MTQATSEKSFIKLKRHLAEYRPQLEKAMRAIQVLETADTESEEFAQALADLQVCATVLEPYSEGMVEAIAQFTEEQSA